MFQASRSTDYTAALSSSLGIYLFVACLPPPQEGRPSERACLSSLQGLLTAVRHAFLLNGFIDLLNEGGGQAREVHPFSGGNAVSSMSRSQPFRPRVLMPR